MPGLPVLYHLPECSKSCTLRRWCHPAISSSVSPFSPCLWSFPASGSFQMSQFFTSGGQSIGASALASVLPMSIQDWFPLGLTGLISLQSKRLSKPSPLQHHYSHEKLLYLYISIWSMEVFSTFPLHLLPKEEFIFLPPLPRLCQESLQNVLLYFVFYEQNRKID